MRKSSPELICSNFSLIPCCAGKQVIEASARKQSLSSPEGQRRPKPHGSEDIPIVNLVDRCAALWTALAGDHPHSVTTLKTGRATASGYLGMSAYSLKKARAAAHCRTTYRHCQDTFGVEHARNSDFVNRSVLAHGSECLKEWRCWRLQ
jgi:hypothetical protein